MGSCISSIQERWARSGLDLDNVFAYNTAKIVRVKDRRLGLLRLALVLAIFVYIVIYVVIIKQAYLKYETPVGTVYLSLQKPDIETRVDQLPYCTQYGGGNPLPVCDPNAPRTTKAVYYPLNCTYWDASQALYPADQRDSMFITTRVSVSIDTYNNTCGNNNGPASSNSSCSTTWISGATQPLYVAGVDDFTIRIAHSMQAREFFEETGDSDYAGSSDDMDGWLLDQENNRIKSFIAVQGNAANVANNVLSLRTLLNATLNRQAIARGDIGDLSMQSDDPVGGKNCESERSAGILLFVTIVYTRTHPGRPTYNMHVARIPGSAYKVVETQRLNDTARLTLNRHGVKVVFIMTGQIGKFDFQTLLVQLVSAFALLSVATLIVENAMLYLLPEKKMYAEYKFEETADFGDVRKEKRRHVHADGHVTETTVHVDSAGNETVVGSQDFNNMAAAMAHESAAVVVETHSPAQDNNADVVITPQHETPAENDGVPLRNGAAQTSAL